MPIGEPIIHVECDKCGEVSDPYSLTMLADDRNLRPRLKREGWKVDAVAVICPECNSEEP